MPGLPLEGLRIVDMGIALAVPYGTMLLADLGAQVIRVESTQVFPNQTRGLLARPSKEAIKTMAPVSGGYPDREPGERPWNRFPWANCTGRNKLGMTVDLRKPSGLEVFRRLVKISDAVVENNTPASLERMGITYDWMRAIKEDIIFVQVSSFGQNGPYRDYRALGLQVDAFCGHDMLRRYRDRDPSYNTWAVPSDYAGGIGAAAACLLALIHRKRTGEGQHVDISMVENFVNLIGHIVMDYTMNGRVQESHGNRDPDMVQGVYRCKGDDRWVAITIATDEQWRGFLRAAGDMPELRDARFATVPERLRNQDALDPLIEKFTSKYDHREVAELLQRHGVPAGPVLDDADAYGDPQLRERGFFIPITHADAGQHLYPGMPWKMSRTPLQVRTPPVRLGEHNEYIYRELLGYSQEEYRQLETEGHIGTEYAPHIR
jgi:crotonobetainyl-CoA:carnitine CoA-transferase CaiB-like acyl-CoA transferase